MPEENDQPKPIVVPNGDETMGTARTATGTGNVTIQEVKEEEGNLESTNQVEIIAENYDDEPDETLAERLWGLTEMFPDPVREYVGKLSKITASAARTFFSYSCRAIWVATSSSVILFAPVILEVERAKIREMQLSQQKNVLLGPAAAMTSLAMKGRGEGPMFPSS